MWNLYAPIYCESKNQESAASEGLTFCLPLSAGTGVKWTAKRRLEKLTEGILAKWERKAEAEETGKEKESAGAENTSELFAQTKRELSIAAQSASKKSQICFPHSIPWRRMPAGTCTILRCCKTYLYRCRWIQTRSVGKGRKTMWDKGERMFPDTSTHFPHPRNEVFL